MRQCSLMSEIKFILTWKENGHVHNEWFDRICLVIVNKVHKEISKVEFKNCDVNSSFRWEP